ncbi:MAG: ferredoxin [bacterium]
MSQNKQYQIRFDADNCIGAGKCAEKAPEFWSLNLETGIAEPQKPIIDESELEANLEAAQACPARNGKGVIRIYEKETDEKIY